MTPPPPYCKTPGTFRRVPGVSLRRRAKKGPGLPGGGEAAAHSVSDACTGGEEFISIDEVQSRAKVSSAVIDVLKSAGALQGLPDSSQTSLF